MNEDRIKAIKSLLDDIEGNKGVENRNAYICHDMLIKCVGVLKGFVDDYCHNDSSSDVDSVAEKDSEPHAVMSLKTLVDMIAHAKSEYARIKNTELLDAKPVRVKMLREYKDTYASVTRGKVTYWLVFNWEGLKVTKEFEDFATGNYESCEMDINTKTPYNPFGYNTTDTETVELAVQLAKDWKSIKRVIGNFVDETNQKADAYMNVLTKFKI